MKNANRLLGCKFLKSEITMIKWSRKYYKKRVSYGKADSVVIPGEWIECSELHPPFAELCG